jgi:putative endonuclease
MVRYYWTYILKCSDGSFYIGMTNDIDQRILQHNSGVNSDCYTFKKRPVELVYQAMFQNPNEAIAFEKKLKGWSRAKKIALINGEFEKLAGLSKKNFKK